MNVNFKSKRSTEAFHHSVGANEFHSELEIPNGRDPTQNAWLTITINYTINFVDSRNLGGRAYLKNKKAFIRDSNKDEFELADWDLKSRSNFIKRFEKGEDFWNFKFLLITPRDYAGLDYTSWAGPGWAVRPNVICLFRLKSGGTPNHLTITAVRPEISGWSKFWGTEFRSNSVTYDEEDVSTKTLWHELGHALDQLHIKALKGDAKCLVSPNDDPCYDGDNIMGRGTKLETLNAKAWRELIFHHTGIPITQWGVTMSVNTPPRKIPMGVQMVAPVLAF